MATIDFGFEFPEEIPDQQGKVSAPQVPGLSEDLKPAPQQPSPELSAQLPALQQLSPALSAQLASAFEMEGPSTLERGLDIAGIQLASLPSYVKYAGAEMSERPFNLGDVLVPPKALLKMATRMAFEPEDIDAAAREIAIFDEMMLEASGKHPSQLDPEALGESIVSSTVSSYLPSIGLALVNPVLGLGYLGMSSFVQKYGESRLKRGRTVEQSAADGAFAAAAEGLPGIVPLGQLFKKGVGFVSRVITAGLSESASEMVTEALNMGYDMGILDDDITLREAVERLIASGIVGNVMGIGGGAIVHPAIVAAERDAQQRASQLGRGSTIGDIERIAPRITIAPRLTNAAGMRLTAINLEMEGLNRSLEETRKAIETAPPERLLDLQKRQDSLSSRLRGLQAELEDIMAMGRLPEEDPGWFEIPQEPRVDISDWTEDTTRTPPEGTSPARIMQDPEGRTWLVKEEEPEAAENEVLAGRIYNIFGAPIPMTKVATDGSGKTYVASLWVDGVQKAEETLAPQPEQAEVEAPVNRTVKIYTVETEDHGTIQDVRVIRNTDGTVVIVDDISTMKYGALFAHGKSDKELLAFSYKQIGFQDAQESASAPPSQPEPAPQPQPSDATGRAEALPVAPRGATSVRDQVRKFFPIDVLLRNWDVAGLTGDNLQMSPQGIVYRIEAGGALRYRGMQGKKPNEWDGSAREWYTLRESEQGKKWFKDLKPDEIEETINALNNGRKRAEVMAAVDEVISDPELRKQYKKMLITRMDSILELYRNEFKAEVARTEDDGVLFDHPAGVFIEETELDTGVNYIPNFRATGDAYTDRLRHLMKPQEYRDVIEWTGDSRPSGLKKAHESLTQNVAYQATLSEFLDLIAPNSDYITIFKGHHPSDPIYTSRAAKVSKTDPSWMYGNGSLSFDEARSWAEGKAFEELEKIKLQREQAGKPPLSKEETTRWIENNAAVSAIRVPKRDVYFFDNGMGEMELMFRTQKAQHGGTVRIRHPATAQGSMISPVYYYSKDIPGQMVLPGFAQGGIDRSHLYDVAPDQIDMYGEGQLDLFRDYRQPVDPGFAVKRLLRKLLPKLFSKEAPPIRLASTSASLPGFRPASLVRSEAQQLFSVLKGKGVVEVAEYIRDTAKTETEKAVAAIVARMLKELKTRGVELDLVYRVRDSKRQLAPVWSLDEETGRLEYQNTDVVSPETRANTTKAVDSLVAKGAGGLVSTDFKATKTKTGRADIKHSVSVVLDSHRSDRVVILHELIHGITSINIDMAKQFPNNVSAELRESVQELTNILAVVKDYASRVDSAFILNPDKFKDRIAPNSDYIKTLEAIRNGANVLTNERELVAWALSSREVQRFLAEIPYKQTKTSVWSHLKGVVRRFFGIEKKPEDLTALEAVFAHSEAIMRSNSTFHEAFRGLPNFHLSGNANGMVPSEEADLQQDLDKYNWFIKHAWTLTQLVEKNKHVPGMLSYMEAVTAWHNKKMQWISRADRRVKEWQSLGADRADRLANFLFDLTTMKYLPKGEKPRWPTPEEFTALREKYRIDDKPISALDGRSLWEFYLEIRSDFAEVLNQIEASLLKDLNKRFADSPGVLAIKTKAVQNDIDKLRKQPYFPLARFGEWTVVVKDKEGHIVHMEAFESQRAQEAAFKRIRRQFSAEHAVRMDKIKDDVYSLRGLPPSFLDRVKEMIANDEKLTVDERRARIDQLEQLAFEFAPAQSFKRHFEKRDYTPGYSKDVMRSYAEYFLHGANHIARMEFGPDLDEAIMELADDIRRIRKENLSTDVRKRVQLLEHLEQHRNYIMSPENDWATLRAIGFMWYLGFNVKSAAVNLAQVPMVGLPYLSARFGDRKSIAALTHAMADIKAIYTGRALTKQQETYLKILDMGIQQGWLNESMATELAGVSESSVLKRMFPGNKWQRFWRDASWASAWLFQHAEHFNRRIMARAAAELALRNPDSAYLDELQRDNPKLFGYLLSQGFTKVEARAYLAAKDATLRSQYEYAHWNRPRFMQGKKGVIFLFWMHIQNTLWFARYSPGRGRMLLMLLAMSGIMGLPFAEDLEDFARWAGRRMFGKDWNLEEEIREMLVQLGSEHPDFWLHGASRYGFGLAHIADLAGIPIPGVDLSGSLSMGDIIPMTEAMASPGDFSDKFLKASTDVGGGVFALAVAMLQSLADTENPDGHKRWERAMPSFMKSLSKATRFYDRGFESTYTNARVVEFDKTDPEHLAEIVAQGLGFTPTRLTQKWDYIRAQEETIRYWRTRRGVLLRQLDFALDSGDKEAIADANAAIRDFNSTAPLRGLKISHKDRLASIRERRRRRVLTSRGIPAERRYRELARGVQGLYPEVNPSAESRGRTTAPPGLAEAFEWEEPIR